MEERDILRYRIKDILRSQRKTLTWLAGEIGLTQPNLSSALNYRYNLSLPTLTKIAYALNVEFRELFDVTGWCDDDHEETKITVDKLDGNTVKIFASILHVSKKFIMDAEDGHIHLPMKFIEKLSRNTIYSVDELLMIFKVRS